MKNTIIGFLMATCMFLTIGASEEVESMEMFVNGQVSVECEAPKYQAFSAAGTMYMINTETGELYSSVSKRIKKNGKREWEDTWERTSPKTDWIEE